MKLYLTYQYDLSEHVTKASKMARDLGWTVIIGPKMPETQRLLSVEDCDALLLLSAWVYDNGIQEKEWNAARKRGKLTRAILVDKNAPWPPRSIEGLSDKDAARKLKEFERILEPHTSPKHFTNDPLSISPLVSEVLEAVQLEIESSALTKVFVAWDTSVKGLDLILHSLQKRPPKGFEVDVPALEGQGAAGEILRNVVLPGIRDSDRVLVVTDRPNANVAFEAGLALGFGKKISLVHFGPDLPKWLKDSVFKGFIVKPAINVESLRSVIISEDNWYKSLSPTAVPQHGSTLFLSPSSYAGAALREEQFDFYPYWRIPLTGFNVLDINREYSGITQVVWSIVAYAEGNDIRDGIENTTNGIIAGWFYARASISFDEEAPKRLTVLRHESARIVADLEVFEKKFGSIDEFAGMLEDVPDRSLPEPIDRKESDYDYGPADYKMVRVPAPNAIGEEDLVWVGVYPVTNQQYKFFCEETDHSPPDNWANTHEPQEPVTHVSVEDAEAFCSWANLQLPDQILWEHFAQVDSKQGYWWGTDDSVLPEVAWFVDNSDGHVHPVGGKKPNTWGIYDVLGNVWNWTKAYEKEVRNPITDDEYEPEIVAKAFGGAYNTRSSDLNSSREHSVTSKESTIGFRCVRLPEPQPSTNQQTNEGIT